nr:PREDICTED: nuclear receptor coactivator 3-like [Paralichthys olivaceus]
MNSPSGSPRMGGPQQGLLMSPRNRGSPKMGANQFSPGGIHSPMSGIGSGGGSGGGTTTFSSSSLNALQAISEGVGSSLPSTLMSPSPAHKPDSSPSIHSSSSSSQPSQPAKPSQDGSKSPAGGLGPGPADHHHPMHHHHHHPHPQAESSGDRPDSQAGTATKEFGEGSNEAGVASAEPPRRVPDSKGHKKLLQLLTSPAEELGKGNSGPTGPPVPPPTTGNNTPAGSDSKDPTGGMTSPSSTGVSSSSSASANPGQAAGQGGVSTSLSSAHYTGSLQEKHKILHKLLQNGNTPDEVAKITAEATGKVTLGNQEGGEVGTGAPGAGPGSITEPKQEQHSPKKEKTHALLHYLLNKDDSKEPADVKPKLEELEGKGPPGAAGGPSRNGPGSGPGPVPEHPESKIKSEPPDDLHNLESILGDLRGSSSDFYPDQAGSGGSNDTGAKSQGCLDDSLQGKI